MAKVSIIVPVYNVENYIRQCLDSILTQTFTDYDVILVDDGSPDKCPDICDEYASIYDNFHVVHKENGGLADARNAGIDCALQVSDSRWLTFVDSDDVIHPRYLEYLFRAATESGASLVGCDCIKGEKPDAEFKCEHGFSEEHFHIDEDKLKELYEEGKRIYWCVVPLLVKKDIPTDNKFTKGRIHEDNGLEFKWLLRSENCSIVNLPLYFYRQVSGSIMHEKFGIKKLDYLWAIEEQIKFYRSIGYNRMLETMLCHYVETAIWFSKRAARELDDKKLSLQILKKAESIIKEYDAVRIIPPNETDYIFKRTHKLRYKISHLMK